VDLAATLASLLGINAPTHAVGRVLTEALAPPRRTANSGHGEDRSSPTVEGENVRHGVIQATPSAGANMAQVSR
jgi:hypothetical protein